MHYTIFTGRSCIKITYVQPKNGKTVKIVLKLNMESETQLHLSFPIKKEDKMDMFDMSGHAKLSVLFDVVELGIRFVGNYLKE